MASFGWFFAGMVACLICIGVASWLSDGFSPVETAKREWTRRIDDRAAQFIALGFSPDHASVMARDAVQREATRALEERVAAEREIQKTLGGAS